MYMILTPLSALFMLWKKLIKKMFKLRAAAAVTEDELKTYVETAVAEGGITEHESDLIRSAIEFDDLDVYDIMTPRVNVVAVEENEDLDEIDKKFFDNGYSRLPVYNKNMDTIAGIIHEKDFYHMVKNGDKPLKEIIQSAVCVSRTMKISAAFRLMQKSKVHMAIVVDEFGGTSGVITMEDIIEELVGEIWDEHDEVEETIVELADGSYSVSGAESPDTLFEKLGVEDSEDYDAATVGGWVTEHMERIPTEGETLQFKNLSITVTKATERTVSEINVKKTESEQKESD
jgi:CBS domain containing-hemolysin-like protein